MKKIVLTFGLICGAIISGMFLVTLPFHDAIGFDRSLILGYTTMVLAFLLIFFGVRSYRDTIGGGRVGFGRALAVGSLIAVVASLQPYHVALTSKSIYHRLSYNNRGTLLLFFGVEEAMRLYRQTAMMLTMRMKNWMLTLII